MGQVYSLNARTGCTHWSFSAQGGVKAAISVGPIGKSRFAAYVGDEKAFVYAIDAVTGVELWRTRVDEHPLAMVTGAPRLYRGRLYVALASQEELASRDDNYVCCTFRGSVVALDAVTGRILWKTYTVDEAPRAYRKTAAGREVFGPAGGGIWNSPTVDSKRRRLYVGTGNSYTDRETGATDSILALDLVTGARVWSKQVSAADQWNTACWEPKTANCPRAEGPDDDFGGPPVLRTLAGGKQILVAGQKSGTVYGFDPDKQGEILWTMKRPARYGSGGVILGVAADPTAVYAPYSMDTGLTAFNVATGTELWHVCSSMQQAALAVIPGVVFSGSTDGHMRAYAAKDGKLIWDFDTAARPYDAVNGVKAFGGGIGGSPQIVGNGFLYVNSGYSYARAGNALLAFTVDGK
jgi:polyvinyl alcohol dehydrogenase (cytochrome)